MLVFCPNCSNILLVAASASGNRFACNTCPYICNIERKIKSKIFPLLKEVDHVMGGSAAWENVDSTEAECPTCLYKKAYFMQLQTRSADEPMTTFYKCANPSCGYNWRD